MERIDEGQLARIGCVYRCSQPARSGGAVHLVTTADGRSVAMRQQDIVDLQSGQASVDDIVRRGRADDVAAPWPTVVRPGALTDVAGGGFREK